MRTLAAILFCLLLAAPLAAQKQKREPLTQDAAGPDRRGRHRSRGPRRPYVKFLDEHSDTIKGLIKRAKSPARSHRLDGELQDFSALMDELGDNLDVYSERKADIRKSLKGLNEGVARWQGVLHDLPSEPGFELSLKEALDSIGDLADQAKQIAADQEPTSKPIPTKRARTATSRSERPESGQDHLDRRALRLAML